MQAASGLLPLNMELYDFFKPSVCTLNCGPLCPLHSHFVQYTGIFPRESPQRRGFYQQSSYSSKKGGTSGNTRTQVTGGCRNCTIDVTPTRPEFPLEVSVVGYCEVALGVIPVSLRRFAYDARSRCHSLFWLRRYWIQQLYSFPCTTTTEPGARTSSWNLWFPI